MAPPPCHSQLLLPNPAILVLDRIEREADRFRMVVHVEQQPVCPLCGEASRSRHSDYSRYLQDLPWQGVSVQLWVTVGRFRGRNPSCPRKIFCERLPQIARAYGRQADRASEIVRVIGYVAGGRPGHRRLARLALVTSDDTVLRRVRQEPRPSLSVGPIRNLGVDDGAWRKGQDYGTILVNLDLHRVSDLLPDRSSESLSAWLKKHPESITIWRDRCGLYADGATLGAPQAQQIADRFHLVLNLSSTMERVLEERSRELILPPEEETAPAPESVCPYSSDATEARSAPSQLTPSQQRRQRRLDRYEEVVARFNAGESQAAIVIPQVSL
jgi:transposase